MTKIDNTHSDLERYYLCRDILHVNITFENNFKIFIE